MTYGIELEYMIVDAPSLNVRPLAEKLLIGEDGAPADEVCRGKLRWSNELVSHVIELKTAGPVNGLGGLEADFQQGVNQINALLRPLKARLLPTAMHPWMDPLKEMVLWPHGNREIYEAYDRIFDCRGHGWANLQSMHINLGFKDEAEFVRLHAAIRLILPLLPALATSSPCMDGRLSGLSDTRLQVYRHNQDRIPAISGLIIPEPVAAFAEYHAKILSPMYAAIAPYDPEGLLQDEWLNSRGAIARFERATIEVRLLDTQECPLADLAVARLVTSVIEGLVGNWPAQNAIATEDLAAILDATIRLAEQALVSASDYLRLLSLDAQALTAGEIWLALAERYCPASRWLVERGSLANRIVKRLGPQPTIAEIQRVYAELADCLANGRVF